MILVRGTCRRRRRRRGAGARRGAAHRASAKLAQDAALRKLQLARDDPGVVCLHHLIAGGFEERHQPAHRRRFRRGIGEVDRGERGVDVEVEEWLGAGDDCWPGCGITPDQLIGVFTLRQADDRDLALKRRCQTIIVSARGRLASRSAPIGVSSWSSAPGISRERTVAP